MKINDKYNNLSIQAKAALWYSFCNIVQKGISFFVIPLYVRVLTTEEYGKYAVFNSWSSILIIFATLNLYCGVFTKAMVDYDKDRDRYISCMQSLSTIITLVLFIVYLGFSNSINNILVADSTTIIMLFTYYITFPAFSFWAVRQRVEYKYINMVTLSLLTAILCPTISIILLKTTQLRELAIIRGTFAVQIIIGLYFYIKQFVIGKFCLYDKYYWKHALKFNIPLIPHYLSLIVLGQSDRIMIQKMCDNASAGIYALASQVSMGITVFTSAINQSLVPWLYQMLKQEDYNGIKKPYIKLNFILACFTMLIIFLAPELIKTIGSNEYYQAVWIMPAVSISVFITFCYSPLSSTEFYYNATKGVMYISTISALLNISLNYIFIEKFGYKAAAYTTLICYFLQLLMHHYYYLFVCKHKNITQKLFNMKYTYTVIALLLFTMIYALNLYDTALNRYVIMFLLTIIITYKIYEYSQSNNKSNTKKDS